MDERLISFFEQELRHLRETAQEFARSFPSKAPGLALNQTPADPYVERLLEGTAFLAARVRLKLDTQFPQFTQSLLETVYPDLLTPTPSMAVVRLTPDPKALPPPQGLLVKRGSPLVGVPGSEPPPGTAPPLVQPAPCTFVLAQETRLLPIELVSVDWLVRDLDEAGIDPEFEARAALRIRLRRKVPAPWREYALDPLVLFAPPAEGLGQDIIGNILAHQSGLVLRDGSGRAGKVVWSARGRRARKMGFDRESALLPCNPRTFEGFRLLREYFALPERYLFFQVAGFREGLSKCANELIELVVPLRESAPRLERDVGLASLELFCTPAINLFEKEFNQVIEPSRFSEFHVVPDANRPLDFEVHTILEVEGYGNSSAAARPFSPFFRTRHREKEGAAFFTVTRQPRMLTPAEREGTDEAPYAGSESFLSLVDTRHAPFAGDLRQLAFTTLCTNRHLPILLAGGKSVWKLGGGVKAAARILVGPTLPSFTPVDGEYAWRLLSSFSANYLTLVDSEDGQAQALRELLALHAGTRSDWARRQIEALRRVDAVPVQRPLYDVEDSDGDSPISVMGRGLEVTVEFDEGAYAGHRLFLLGAVLSEFFARYVSLQSFTETVIRTWPDGRERMRWSYRGGLKPWL